MRERDRVCGGPSVREWWDRVREWDRCAGAGGAGPLYLRRKTAFRSRVLD